MLSALIRTIRPTTIRAARTLAMTAEQKEEISNLVKADNVVVFMKGVPEEPKCGFSRAVCQIFEMHGVDKFSAHNILEDQDLRENIKEFSEWPTIPQVYMGGEFVGGCDIMIQMHQSGELKDLLEENGIKSLIK